MNRTWIKICGITTPSDAKLAMEASADYLGVILVPDSPRNASLAQAEQILNAVGNQIPVIAVFQDAPLELVKSTLQSLPFWGVQLHGEEAPAFCRSMTVPVLKAMPRHSLKLRSQLEDYLPLDQNNVWAISLDRPKQQPVFEPVETLEVRGSELHPLGIPFFWAGGLTSEDVGSVLKRIQPDGVDVAAGVESSPGVKDPEKLMAFCKAVREYDRERGVAV